MLYNGGGGQFGFHTVVVSNHKPVLGRCGNSFKIELVLVFLKAFGSVVLSIPKKYVVYLFTRCAAKLAHQIKNKKIKFQS